jgi:hypothetical protein
MTRQVALGAVVAFAVTVLVLSVWTPSGPPPPTPEQLAPPPVPPRAVVPMTPALMVNTEKLRELTPSRTRLVPMMLVTDAGTGP